MADQIRLKALLKDPNFKAFFMTIPKIEVACTTPPWRLYAQREQGGKWARKDCHSYSQAFRGVKLRLSDFHDLVIHSKPQAFRPPIVKVNGKRFYMPVPEGHIWCVYCRRPTVFSHFSKHHAMPGAHVADYELRCGVCGARAAGMKQYRTPLDYEEYRASLLEA